MLKRQRCLVIVPTYEGIVPACEDSLAELERRGYRVRRALAGSTIDVGRSRIVTAALADGYDEIMWIDPDVAFEGDAVDRLRERDVPLVGGVYPRKAIGALSFHAEDLDTIIFGRGGGLIEVRYVAAGFLYTRREVYDAMRKRFELQVCNTCFGDKVVPYFLPQVIQHRGSPWYLADDYSFCHRARQCGYTVWVDTAIHLRHVGRYAYSWNDVCDDRPRHGDDPA